MLHLFNLDARYETRKKTFPEEFGTYAPNYLFFTGYGHDVLLTSRPAAVTFKKPHVYI